jgi:hypothetical protein
MQDARGKYGMSRFHVAIAIIHSNDDGAAGRVRVIGVADDSHHIETFLSALVTSGTG